MLIYCVLQNFYSFLFFTNTFHEQVGNMAIQMIDNLSFLITPVVEIHKFTSQKEFHWKVTRFCEAIIKTIFI